MSFTDSVIVEHAFDVYRKSATQVQPVKKNIRRQTISSKLGRKATSSGGFSKVDFLRLNQARRAEREAKYTDGSDCRADRQALGTDTTHV
jgi:hypothetical protein